MTKTDKCPVCHSVKCRKRGDKKCIAGFEKRFVKQIETEAQTGFDKIFDYPEVKTVYGERDSNYSYPVVGHIS